MKNKHMEQKCNLWKHNPTWRKTNKDGIVIFHCYDGDQKQREHTWWDDFGFYINGVYHVVWWIHPRMKFKDEVNNRAHDKVAHLYPNRHDDMFSSGKKYYKKVGISRKKLVGTEMGESSLSHKAWYYAYQVAEDEELKTSDYVAMSSIKTTWLGYGKGIDICFPVELRNEDDIAKFAKMIKQCIINKVPLPMDYKGYSKDDWAAEGHLSTLTHSQQLKEN